MNMVLMDMPYLAMILGAILMLSYVGRIAYDVVMHIHDCVKNRLPFWYYHQFWYEQNYIRGRHARRKTDIGQYERVFGIIA